MTFRPDPKRPPRVKDSKAMRTMHARGGYCAICFDTANLSLHHVLPRSQGGDDVPANLVFLHGSGTTGCHGAVENAEEFACGALGAYLLEKRLDTLEYLRERLGPSAASEWLLRHLHTRMPA